MPLTVIRIIIAIVGFGLAGCQHTPKPNPADQPRAWRVLERVGDVRSAMGPGPEATQLRPGETITGDRRVITGKGALLILAADGIQLTAGENTSLMLSERAQVDLVLNQGWLRVRIENAVNRETRIQTAHFDMNTSATLLTLRASNNATDLDVETGSVRLATTDGRHQATLVAGTAAKIDQMTSDDLFIQTGAEEAFALPTDRQMATRDYRSFSLADANSSRTRGSQTSLSTAAVMLLESTAILPASRKKENITGQLEIPKQVEKAGFRPFPAAPEANQALPSKAMTVAPINNATSWSQDSNIDPDDRSNDLTPIDNRIVDPLQLQFDQLAKGLVDHL